MSIDFNFIYTSFFQILKALPLTLVITIVPLIAGFGMGLVTALVRIYRYHGSTGSLNSMFRFSVVHRC